MRERARRRPQPIRRAAAIRVPNRFTIVSLALDDPDRTVVGELTLTGFSVPNVEAIARRFLGAIAWKP